MEKDYHNKEMTSSIILRPYQTDIISRTRALMQKGYKSILITSPCGSGKTAFTAHMLHTAAGKGMRSLFVVHRRELIKQSMQAFDKEGLKYGVIAPGFMENRHELVQIASIATLARRLDRVHRPTLIVYDEAHHLAASSWARVYGHFRGAYHVGLTATPERLDGRGLSDYFKNMLQGPSTADLIKQGYLSNFRLFAPVKINVDGVHTRMGDYVKSELSAVIDRPSITGSAVEHYRRFCYGKRAIVFCVSIAHSKHVISKFQEAGFKAAHIDGETETDVRDKAINDFKNGNIQVLSNVDLLGEGFDVPSVEAVILLRPTCSLGLYLQTIGRALRPAPGKLEAIILDHVGNYERHGLPDDERVWSLIGRAIERGGKTETKVSVKICPKCFAAQQGGRPSCKFCGFEFEITPREVQEKEGELTEVERETIRRNERVKQGMAESLEDLYRLGVSRGYKHARRWAFYVFKSRQQKRLGRV